MPSDARLAERSPASPTSLEPPAESGRHRRADTPPAYSVLRTMPRPNFSIYPSSEVIVSTTSAAPSSVAAAEATAAAGTQGPGLAFNSSVTFELPPSSPMLDFEYAFWGHNSGEAAPWLYANSSTNSAANASRVAHADGDTFILKFVGTGFRTHGAVQYGAGWNASDAVGRAWLLYENGDDGELDKALRTDKLDVTGSSGTITDMHALSLGAYQVRTQISQHMNATVHNATVEVPVLSQA